MLPGLVTSKKKTLGETPVMVENIRAIGQLITAEYSGEVISTLQEELKRTDSLAKENNPSSKPIKSQPRKVSKDRQLIAVGRGRVRAGFDFTKVTSKNFKYAPESKHLYVYGLKPEILYCDINPWFIPEKKIRGFEIIAATKHASNDEDVRIVKNSCVDRLREKAIAQGLVDRAKINAERCLIIYLSIVTKKELEGVTIVAL